MGGAQHVRSPIKYLVERHNLELTTQLQIRAIRLPQLRYTWIDRLKHGQARRVTRATPLTEAVEEQDYPVQRAGLAHSLMVQRVGHLAYPQPRVANQEPPINAR